MIFYGDFIVPKLVNKKFRKKKQLKAFQGPESPENQFGQQQKNNLNDWKSTPILALIWSKNIK